MTTIGFIGSGKIGGTVARLCVARGYEVVLSNSRGPETLEGLAKELGPLAAAGTPDEAAEAGHLVVVSIPVKAFPSVPAGPLAGFPVLDTCNYYPQRDGHLAELDDGSLTSSGLLQRDLPGARVVKVFNNIFFKQWLFRAWRLIRGTPVHRIHRQARFHHDLSRLAASRNTRAPQRSQASPCACPLAPRTAQPARTSVSVTPGPLGRMKDGSGIGPALSRGAPAGR